MQRHRSLLFSSSRFFFLCNIGKSSSSLRPLFVITHLKRMFFANRHSFQILVLSWSVKRNCMEKERKKERTKLEKNFNCERERRRRTIRSVFEIQSICWLQRDSSKSIDEMREKEREREKKNGIWIDCRKISRRMSLWASSIYTSW